MRKLVFFIFGLFYINCVFAIDDQIILSKSSPILGEVLQSSYDNSDGLNIEKIIFPKKNGVTVNLSPLETDSNADLDITGNFWIKSTYNESISESGWCTFDHGVTGYKAKLVNQGNGTFILEGAAWSKTIGWILFGDTGKIGGKVTYNSSTGKFSGAGRSENIGWIPLDGLSLIITPPEFVGLEEIFAVEKDKEITIKILTTSLKVILENSDGTYYTDTIIPVDGEVVINHDFLRAAKNDNYTPQDDLYDYQLKDEFGNTIIGRLQVTSAEPDLNKTEVTLSTGDKVGNGNDYHSFELKLRDEYNNPVFNQAGIKEVKVEIKFNNTIDMNQIDSLGIGDAIKFDSGDFLTLIGGIGTTNATNTYSTTGNYNIKFLSYGPSKTGYNYTTENNDINISELSVDVTALDGKTNVGETGGERYIYGGTKPESSNFSFVPAVKVDTLNNDFLRRDIESEFSAKIEKSGTISVSSLEIKQQLSIGSNILMSFQDLNINSNNTDNLKCTGFYTSTGYIITSSKCADDGFNASNIIMSNISSNVDSYISKFNATPKIVNLSLDSLNMSYNSIVSYTIDGKDIVHKSLEKNSIGGGTSISNEQIKVAGIINEGFNVDPNSSNLIVEENISKAEFKQQVSKNVESIIKSGVFPDNIKFYDTNTTLTSLPSGVDTIIVKGADLYINGNILKQSSGKLNSIVVLKEDGIGGNLWLGKNVKFISGIIYVEGHVFSGDMNSNYYYADSAVSINQLFIKGSLISNNTIGGSSFVPYTCPYPIEASDCTELISKRCDLNHLRHFVAETNIGDGDGAGEKFVTGVYGGDYIDMSKAGYREAPVIIEYDTLIQTNIPVLFQSN